MRITYERNTTYQIENERAGRESRADERTRIYDSRSCEKLSVRFSVREEKGEELARLLIFPVIKSHKKHFYTKNHNAQDNKSNINSFLSFQANIVYTLFSRIKETESYTLPPSETHAR